MQAPFTYAQAKLYLVTSSGLLVKVYKFFSAMWLDNDPTFIEGSRLKLIDEFKMFSALSFKTDREPNHKKQVVNMAGLFDKQAEIYSDSRPTYPSEWFSKLAALTSQHSLAWDAGTGSGQAAFAVAEYFEQVIGTDISEAQLKHARQHPRVKYIHTPLSLSDDELVSLIGGENSVDLVTVAEAVHWFELPKFYSIVTRVLRKPGGVIAIWGYNKMEVSPTFDPVMKRFRETTLPFYDPKAQCLFDGYRTLPFPFDSVGLGSEGEPLQLDIKIVMSFEEMVRGLRSSSAVTKAKDQGVDLLPEEVIKELESAWGGPNVIKTVTCKAFMLAGKVKV